MKRLLAVVLLTSASALAWALPTLKQVEDEVKAGRYTQAESMMSEVVAEKGDSARAHYVYAEVLAHNGKFAKAAEEARRARQIDPDIKFTSAEQFRNFEKTLQREENPVARATTTTVAPARAAPVERSSGVPSWIWIAALAAIAFFLWRGFARSRAAAPAAGFMPGAAGASGMGMGPSGGMPPYGPGYPPPAGGGSGLLGTGLAVAGGVAGGMALDRLLHSHDGGGNTGNQFGGGGGDGGSYDAGSAARELESRPVDFGTGGNDWDSGGSGGSSDGGGSDGGGGWD